MSTGPHLHYAVIKGEAGEEIIAKSEGTGGSIGIQLNKETTLNPAEYDNYDPVSR